MWPTEYNNGGWGLLVLFPGS
eukprot:SAG11_NODE_33310_length_278_cov_0.575419_1_plen_20_part_10